MTSRLLSHQAPSKMKDYSKKESVWSQEEQIFAIRADPFRKSIKQFYQLPPLKVNRFPLADVLFELGLT